MCRIPNRVLLPGLYAEATITLERKGNAISRAPAGGGSAERIRRRSMSSDPSNKIEIRPVVLGIQTATDAEVLSGLKEGDRSWSSATAAV